MPTKRTIPSVCPVCGADFLAIDDSVRAGYGKYCSHQCGYAARRQRARPTIEIDPDGLTARIPLLAKNGSVRAYALIDAVDAEWASQWPWHVGTKNYVVRNIWNGTRYKSLRLHRELMGLAEGDLRQADHIDRDPLNCRRDNLRIVTGAQNVQNTRSRVGSSSQFRGVSKRGNRWRANLQVSGNAVRLGTFDSEIEAAEAVRSARLVLMTHAVD